jgi:preprotein translocase subunit SecE
MGTTVSQVSVQQSGDAQQPGFIQRVQTWPAAIQDYVSDLRSEMSKVSWPSRKQVEATTTVVVVSVFAFAAYFGVVDFLVGKFIERIFSALAK